MDGNLLSLTDFLLAKGVACETNVIYGVLHMLKGGIYPGVGRVLKAFITMQLSTANYVTEAYCPCASRH